MPETRRNRPPSYPSGKTRPPSRRPPTGPPRTPRRSPPKGPTQARRPRRVADLFAGIGGFHLAFARAGARTVFACDNDVHARATYEANFRPSNSQLFDTGNFAEDIRTVDPTVMPDVDVVAAGFPCQPFSIAGRRQGFDDARGTLFFDIARIVEAKRPAAFFLENVQGLRSHDQGRTLGTIERILTQHLGYSLHTRIVRACDHGLPQLRPRLFMVGFRDPSTPFQFPEPIPLTMTMSDIFEGTAHREIGYTILARGGGRRPGQKWSWDRYLVDGEVRRLGVEQARRMQGFPDDFMFPVSDAQAMKQLGNSVAIPAVEASARAILSALDETVSEGQP